ncbi:MAG: transcription antitermination factor NusB [Bacillota bacterium]
MSRRKARISALETLFEIESRGAGTLTPDSMAGICDEALQRNGVAVGEYRDFAASLVRGTWEHRAEYDEGIACSSHSWSLHRIGRVETAIMRMALHEMKRMSTPPSVAINEAVELTKRYASERAASFVNGILGSLVADIQVEE